MMVMIDEVGGRGYLYLSVWKPPRTPPFIIHSNHSSIEAFTLAFRLCCFIIHGRRPLSVSRLETKTLSGSMQAEVVVNYSKLSDPRHP